MKIEVDLNQRWSEVAYYYTSNRAAMDALLEVVKERDKHFQLQSLTCGDLCVLLEGGVPKSVAEMAANYTVRQYFQLVNAIRESVKAFGAFLERTNPPQTQTQRQAASGLLEITIEENVLLLLKSFYGLHSLEDAQRMSVYEYMIARRAEYNRQRAEYNMSTRIKS